MLSPSTLSYSCLPFSLLARRAMAFLISLPACSLCRNSLLLSIPVIFFVSSIIYVLYLRVTCSARHRSIVYLSARRGCGCLLFLCLHMCTHAVLNLNLTHAFRCTTPYATAAADTDVTSFCVECFVLQSECSLVLCEA